MERKPILFATAITAVAILLVVWATASEYGKPAPPRPVSVTVPSARAAPHAKAATPTRAYLIECKLLETAPDGKPTVLASPKVMTVEGRPAGIRVGREVTPPKGSELAKGPFEGLTFELRVYRSKCGPTFLDAKVQTSRTADNTKGDSVRLVNVGLRLIEAVTLGEKITIPFGHGHEKTAARRFEVVVTEVAGNPAAATMGKLPLKTSRNPMRTSPSATAR